MASANIKPMADRVVIEPLEETEEMRGGLYIPDTAKEKPQEAVVVATGPGKVQDDGNLTPLDVKVNDRVLFGKYAGTDITLDGEDYVILREEDILAIFESKKKGK